MAIKILLLSIELTILAGCDLASSNTDKDLHSELSNQPFFSLKPLFNFSYKYMREDGGAAYTNAVI